MTITAPAPAPARDRRVEYLRQCDRCPNVRRVRDPHARLNLCRDCTQVLTPAERKRWAA